MLKKITKIMIALLIMFSSIFHVQPTLGQNNVVDTFETQTNEYDSDADENLFMEDSDTTVSGEAVEIDDGLVVITFDLQNDDFEFIVQYLRLGDYIDKPIISLPSGDYEFSGWYTSPMGDVEFDFSMPVVEDTIIYARWQPITELMRTVTFNFNGGEGEREVEDGLLITIPYGITTTVVHESSVGNLYDELSITIRREGYQLIGWSTVLNSSIDVFDFEQLIEEDIILYALWEDATSGSIEPPTDIQNPEPTEPQPELPPADIQNPEPTEPQPPVSGPIPDLVYPPIMNAPEVDLPMEREMIASEPPESSGVVMEVDEEGNIVITGPSIGEEQGIIITNAPPGVKFLRIGAFDEVFILFPAETVPEEVDITTPTAEWTYEFFTDVEDNIVLVLLPPGVALTEVLRDPLNPQPADPSLLDTVMLDEDDENDEDQDKPRDPDEDMINSEDDEDDDDLDSDTQEMTDTAFPTGVFSNSLALLGVFFLKCGQMLLSKNKVE